SENEPEYVKSSRGSHEVSEDLPVPSSSEAPFIKQSSPNEVQTLPSETGATTVRADRSADSAENDPQVSHGKSPSGSSDHSQSALHPMLKQQHSPFTPNEVKMIEVSPKIDLASPTPGVTFDGVKFKNRSGGRPKDPVWVYFNINNSGTDERAACKYCGWHVERPKAFRMRDHIAQCARVDPALRAEMSQLIAFKEAAAVAKQEEKAGHASGSNNLEVLSSASKKRKMEPPTISKPVLSAGRSPITCHVLDATSGKPGDGMGIRLDRLTSNGFVLIAKGTTDGDGRCNGLLTAGSRPDIGVYKVTFFSNEFYQKRGIVSFYPFIEITFEIKDPSEHYHIPLLLSPYAFSTYRGS
ncbi:hypothetical protein BY996DRAFT_4573662, partial [Phakopsora pachyrhizi]